MNENASGIDDVGGVLVEREEKQRSPDPEDPWVVKGGDPKSLVLERPNGSDDRKLFRDCSGDGEREAPTI